jgi:fibronectin type 3 domain-containing protein
MNKWVVIVAALLVSTIGFGCLSDIEEVPLVLSGTDIPSPEGLSARVSDGSVSLEWRAVAGVSAYRIYRASLQSLDPVRIAETADTFYTDTDLINGRIYYYSVSSVTADNLEGSRSEVIAAVPSVYAIMINGGAELTSSRIVTLNLTGPSTTILMQIGHDPVLAGATWERFTATRSWQLEGGDGLKTVYAAFRDEGGTTSPVTSAAITLDTYAEITGLSVMPMPSIYSPGSSAHFTMSVANDETGGEAWLQIEGFPLQIALYDDGNGGDPTAGDGVYEADFRFPLGIRGVDLTVTGSFIDEASNRSSAYEMQTLISFTDPPEAVLLIGAVDSTTSSITIRWESSEEEHFSCYRIYRATSPGVEENPASLVTTLFNAEQTNYTDQGLIEGRIYYYRIFVVNDLSETAGSNERSAATFDAYPNPVVLDSLSAIGDDRLTLTWSRNENTDFLEYRIYRSTAPGVTDVQSDLVATILDRTRTFYDDSGLDTQLYDYYYRVYVFDASGKASPSNEMSSNR